MQQYFIKNGFFFKEDLHHIVNVMRFKTGTKVCVVENGKKFIATLEIEGKNVAIANVEDFNENNENTQQVVIGLGLLKSDKFEYAIQKCAELGVSKIIPITFARNIVKVSDNIKKKLERWNKISKEACEQSKRNSIMEVLEPMSIKQIISLKDYDQKFVCYESKEGNFLFNELQLLKSSITLIGPEGGIEQSEINTLSENGFKVVSLSKQILRAETAAIMAAATFNIKENN